MLSQASDHPELPPHTERCSATIKVTLTHWRRSSELYEKSLNQWSRHQPPKLCGTNSKQQWRTSWTNSFLLKHSMERKLKSHGSTGKLNPKCVGGTSCFAEWGRPRMTVILENTKNVKMHYINPKGKPTGPISMISSRMGIQKLIDLQNRKGFGTTLSPCVKILQVSHHWRIMAVYLTLQKIRQTSLTDSTSLSLLMRTQTFLFQTQMVTLTWTCNKSR